MITSSSLKAHKLPIACSLLSVALYASFAYDLARTDFSKLLSLWFALFLVAFQLYKTTKWDFKFLVVAGIAFRLVFLFAIPNLSQDFYRFIWDGRMLLEGYNPYLYLPETFIAEGNTVVFQAKELYEGMGELNGSHFTNYPPLNQLCFAIAGLFAGKSILGSAIVLRLLVILADLGILFFGKRLLQVLELPVHRIFWYFLNPFIIIELTGNLHFEGVMLFFLVLNLYLLHKGKWLFAALAFAASISVKLIPLMLLPLFFGYFLRPKEAHLDFKKLIGFYAVVGLCCLLLFAPFFSSAFINNYSQTVGLWFTNFEFNGSLYYIAREIGYSFRGYNEIKTIGQYTPFIVVAFVLGMALFRRNDNIVKLITAMLLCLSFYYFVSTTVHPWYVASLLILSLFTNYRFPLVWSAVIIFSYLAYGNEGNKEDLWVIALEYLLVYGIFLWEVFSKRRPVLLKHL